MCFFLFLFFTNILLHLVTSSKYWFYTLVVREVQDTSSDQCPYVVRGSAGYSPVGSSSVLLHPETSYELPKARLFYERTPAELFAMLLGELARWIEVARTGLMSGWG